MKRSDDDHRLLRYTPSTPNIRADIHERSTSPRRQRGVEVMATDHDRSSVTLVRVAGQR